MTGAAVFSMAVKEDTSEKVTFEQRPEGDEKMSRVAFWGEECKEQQITSAWCV